MNKFEQLIEYVINDEEDKARDLFHEIVVEKSRTIYEELMAEEEDLEEAKDEESDEELDEAKDEESDEEELDEAKDEESDEELDENFGGDKADHLMNDLETEEEGLNMAEDESEEGEEFAHEEGAGEEDLEDRVVDLEDKLDELMAEFEALIADEQGEEHGEEHGEEEFGGEEHGEEGEEDLDMMENVSLKAVQAVKHGDDGANTKSPTAFNSGKAGMAAKPVSTSTGEEKGRTAPTAKPLIGDVQNTPAGGSKKLSPATKPTLAQASGVNNKSTIA
jgi:hypothetical protein